MSQTTEDIYASEWPIDEPVWYSPSAGIAFAGQIGGRPFRIGEEWCVALKNTHPAYANECHPNTNRTTVRAAHMMRIDNRCTK